MEIERRDSVNPRSRDSSLGRMTSWSPPTLRRAGLDVETISHVINYDMPDTADAYIHRIGRTGRAERTGDAFTLVTPEDTDMVRALDRIMGEPIKRETLEGFNYAVPAPPRSASAHREGTRPRVPRQRRHILGIIVSRRGEENKLVKGE